MQTCKCRFGYGGFTGLVLALSALNAVCPASLAAQSSSAGTAQSTFQNVRQGDLPNTFAPVSAPQPPVPPSVMPPAVENTVPPSLTPSSDMHKAPARPEMPRPPEAPAASQKMSLPQKPAPLNRPQNPAVPAGGGAQKNASQSSPRSALQSVSRGSSRSASNGSALNTSLSAADISTLSSLLGSGNLFSMQGLGGMLSIPGIPDSLTGGASGGLTGIGTPGSLMSGALTGVSGGHNQTAVLLQAVIDKLDALQKTLESQNAGKGAASQSGSAAGSDTKAVQDKGGRGRVEQGGRILRFIAGNYNMLPSCTAVFISRPEADGSFLLTGDRKYRLANSPAGTVYGETFYMLFKAADAAVFNVAFSLSQQPENTDSPLYALTQAPFLQAVRTGNLVTMRVLTENVQTDLLLDIDFNSRGKNR